MNVAGKETSIQVISKTNRFLQNYLTLKIYTSHLFWNSKSANNSRGKSVQKVATSIASFGSSNLTPTLLMAFNLPLPLYCVFAHSNA
ncbi:hypothetical protein L596_024115 [Steinernema carpocapsae]|uniref:Uncharacterized protein n=1 Tax=Steinernema carpocapsae TaxID=34508 RepID=A0A4U5MGG5_STECR|nr:hypothetical protein L596_024115 [Steinernema carpocapsae]